MAHMRAGVPGTYRPAFCLLAFLSRVAFNAHFHRSGVANARPAPSIGPHGRRQCIVVLNPEGTRLAARRLLVLVLVLCCLLLAARDLQLLVAVLVLVASLGQAKVPNLPHPLHDMASQPD